MVIICRVPCTDIRDSHKSRDRKFYSRLIRRRRSGRIPLPNDVAEIPLLPREGKEVTRKVALWYTAKPTNDMRQETMVVRRITSCANLPKTMYRQVPLGTLARFCCFGKIHTDGRRLLPQLFAIVLFST